MNQKVFLLNGKSEIRQACFVALRKPTFEARPSLFHSFRPLIFLVTLGCALTLLAGCATVDPQPFSEFSLAVQELRDGADGALAVNNQSNRAAYIAQIAKQSQSPEGMDAVMNLLIGKVENDPFGWEMKTVPLFMMSARFQSGVYNLNNSLVAYADLLKSLASPELVSRERFDSLARDLDAGLTAAAEQLDFKATDKEIALFSVAARQAAYAFLDNKRSRSLQKVVEANQENIDVLAEQLQEALRLASWNLWVVYKNERATLSKKLTPASDDSLAAREKTVKEFVELNEGYISRLEILRALNGSVQTLPNAHRELAQAIKSPKMTMSSVRNLAKQGRSLNKLFRELKSN